MKTSKVLAIALETIGIVVVIVGINIEFVTGAHIGYVIITSGASLIAIGSLIFAKVIRR